MSDVLGTDLEVALAALAKVRRADVVRVLARIVEGEDLRRFEAFEAPEIGMVGAGDALEVADATEPPVPKILTNLASLYIHKLMFAVVVARNLADPAVTVSAGLLEIVEDIVSTRLAVVYVPK
jgi:hypothetical protein